MSINNKVRKFFKGTHFFGDHEDSSLGARSFLGVHCSHRTKSDQIQNPANVKIHLHKLSPENQPRDGGSGGEGGAGCDVTGLWGQRPRYQTTNDHQHSARNWVTDENLRQLTDTEILR